MNDCKRSRKVIALDGRPFCRNKTGIGRYTEDLLRFVDNNVNDVEFIFVADEPLEFNFTFSNKITIVKKSWYGKRLPHFIWYKLCLGAVVKKNNANIFWSANGYVPLNIKHLTIINICHDFVQLLYPGTIQIVRRYYARLFLNSDLVKSDYVIANSYGTSEKYKKYTGRTAEVVIIPGARPRFSPADELERNRIKKKYKLSSSTILAVGTLEPRKNTAGLIDSFLKLRSIGEYSNYELILVGSKGWIDRGLSEKIEKNLCNGVRPLGYVPDEDMPGLYSVASLFVFPSLYEGYGIPITEALSCGTSVVCTEMQEHREAGLDWPIYSKIDTESLVEAMKEALSNAQVVNSNMVMQRLSATRENGLVEFAKYMNSLT